MSSTIIKHAPEMKEQRSTVPSSGNVTKDVIEGLAKGAVSGIAEPVKDSIADKRRSELKRHKTTAKAMGNSVHDFSEMFRHFDDNDADVVKEAIGKMNSDQANTTADHVLNNQEKNRRDIIVAVACSVGTACICGVIDSIFKTSRMYPKRTGPFGVWYRK